MKRFLLSIWILIGLMSIGMARTAFSQTGVYLLDDLPPASPPPPAPPASLGQQPFPIEKEPDLTPSQSNTTQLNQLFAFENTPDICAAGEGYVTGEFEFLKFPGSVKEYRYQVQGQYGFTDQIAAGAFVPVVNTNVAGTLTGFGDVGIYGQYKFDQFINPEIFDLTAQLDMILPTGDSTAMRDTGKFGIRPLVFAYKDFGQSGPGTFGLYGELGFTITTNSDLRMGIAATYQYNALVGILELYDQAGDKQGRPLIQITPGVSYRGFSPWEITVGVPVGVNKGTPDWGVIFKLTYAFAS
jgi:hypothetical protein